MVSSLHPSQPGVAHVLLGCCSEDVVVTVGVDVGTEVVVVTVVDVVVVTSSLHPNQPGVKHVLVVYVDV